MPHIHRHGVNIATDGLATQDFVVSRSVTGVIRSECAQIRRFGRRRDIVDELTPESDDVVLYKHRYSGFFETDLDAILNASGIRNLVFTGCTTSVCVESTIKHAMFRDYHCLLLKDCTAEAIAAGLPRATTTPRCW